jgi:hypothetical protein
MNKIYNTVQDMHGALSFSTFFNDFAAGFNGITAGANQAAAATNGLDNALNNIGSGRTPGGSGGSGGSGSPSGGSGCSGGSGGMEKVVEDLELEIDRYFELNDAIKNVENSISKLQAERDLITTKGAYRKSIEQEIELINQQIEAIQNLNKEQVKEKDEIRAILYRNGFKFDAEGDISNYSSQLRSLQSQANSKKGEDKEKAISDVEYLVDLIDKYQELEDTIPETNVEILALQKEIQNLNKELKEYTKEVDALGDAYFNISRKIASIDNTIDMNNLLQENAIGERKIELMKEEQQLLKRKQDYLMEQRRLAQKEADELAKELTTYGLIFGEDGTIQNYEQIMNKLTQQANALAGDAQDDAVEEAEELLDIIDQYVELMEETVPELYESWQDYANEIESLDKEMKDLAVQTQKDISSAYEHYLSERYNKIKEELQKEKELYDEQYDEENFQRELDKEQQALDEIAQQIAIYSRDTSEVGKARLEQLKKEYAEQQEAINDMIRENEKALTDKRFAEEEEALDKELELLTSPEHLVQIVNDALGTGLITVGDQVMSLNDLMVQWLDETGDGLYALGSTLRTELLDNLQTAQSVLGDMGIVRPGGSLALASSQALLGSLSNTGALNSSVTFNAPLMTIEGNVDESVMPELKSELAKLEQTILDKIAKSMR